MIMHIRKEEIKLKEKEGKEGGREGGKEGRKEGRKEKGNSYFIRIQKSWQSPKLQ